MDVNKTLISTAMLTAIFEKTKKSNIDLIAPFVLFIISKNEYGVTEEKIITQMEDEFSFLDFPRAVLKKIINKLKKEKKIELKNKKYLLLGNAKKEIDLFNDRHLNASRETKELIDALWNYLKNYTTIKTNYNNVKIAFGAFLDKNGYIIYNNFNPQNLKVKNNDRLQFFIAKFIENQYNNQTKEFKLLINIIEGLLLANVIYLQVTPDNTTNLNKLNCYFDTPFLLRILGFKEKEDNESAVELIDLLKKQGATIKCFTHSFNEVQSILRNYIDNREIGIINPTKTLESLDIEEYNITELNELYMNLEDIFKEKGILIEDKPKYEKIKYNKSKYEDQIDEKKLKEIIIDRYNNKDIKDIIVDNDIDSISAIMRLREGKKIQKFEDCNAIFVTSNHDLRTATKQLLKINERIEISPVISDVDLTAIMWLRSLKDNPTLPKDKLIENARALLKPTPNIIEEFNKCLDKIKKVKYAKDGKALQSLIYTTHFSSKFMDEIEGDINKVNPSTIIKVYEKSLIDAELIEKENLVEKDKNKKLQKEKENLVEKLIMKDKERDEFIDKIIQKYENKINKTSEIICKIVRAIINLLIILLLVVGFLDIIGLFNESKNQYISWILILISIYSLLGEFIELPFLYNISGFIEKLTYTKTLPKITKYFRKKQKKEFDYYFKNK